METSCRAFNTRTKQKQAKRIKLEKKTMRDNNVNMLRLRLDWLPIENR